jgi:hypothetical protein
VALAADGLLRRAAHALASEADELIGDVAGHLRSASPPGTDAVLRGELPEPVLDSYEAERKPQVKEAYPASAGRCRTPTGHPSPTTPRDSRHGRA